MALGSGKPDPARAHTLRQVHCSRSPVSTTASCRGQARRARVATG
ncbi:hypothetical protein [Caudoviricetes sp.]|nr:hypothetical protein [Caudoviricetes sp.]